MSATDELVAPLSGPQRAHPRNARSSSLVVLMLLVAAVVTGCGGNENVRRLHILEADPVLHCPVPGVQVWDQMSRAGTRNGIGFGDTAPTQVSINWRLTGAAAATVMALRSCTTRAGWVVDRYSAGGLDFSATKRFENGWTASLVVGAGQHAYQDQPAASLTLDTDGV